MFFGLDKKYMELLIGKLVIGGVRASSTHVHRYQTNAILAHVHYSIF